METIIHNMPSHQIFMIPGDLASGDYQVEVRATQKNSDTIRIGRLESLLVAP